MNRTILESAKSVQIFKSDRLGLKNQGDGCSLFYPLAYEVVAIGDDGSVHVGGIAAPGCFTKGEVSVDCAVLGEVIRGDIDEMLDLCRDEKSKQNSESVLEFYEELLDYSKKCPGTVFSDNAIEYIEAKIYEYGEKVRLKE